MNEKFYRQLAEALSKNEGDCVVETVLEGEEQGKKTVAFQKETDQAELGLVREENPAVFREKVGGVPRLIICGAGHVSMPIIKIGKMIGFHVTVVEDRPKFADNARAAGADCVLCEPFEEALEKIRGGMDAWFVIVTRGHRYDTDCLRSVLGKKHAYAGMMGSRRRVAIVKQQLEEEGISHGLLEAVHTPIGLKIGAQTPEEIAVSVMAEMIEIKNRDRGTGGYSEEFLTALQEEGRGRKAAATIISRKGSAPRGVGTKMLVFEDGSTVDTIGGGCIESEIMQKALLMLRTGTPAFQICKVDMSADSAEEEGMVCGGTVEVMIEIIG